MNKFSLFLGRMIKEEVKKILLEDSRGRIVSQLKYPRFVADFFHELDSKNSYFWAELLTYRVFRTMHPKTSWSLWLEQMKKLVSVYTSQDTSQDISDIVKSYLQDEAENFRKSYEKFIEKHPFLNVEIANRRAETVKNLYKQYQNELPEEAPESNLPEAISYIETKLKHREEGRKVNKFIKFPNGWFWADLGTSKCSVEQEKMGHCGEDSRGTLFSLRDPGNKPHITLTYNKEQNAVYQIKGKQNTTPDKKYWWSLKKEKDENPDGFFDVTRAEIMEFEGGIDRDFWSFLETGKQEGDSLKLRQNWEQEVEEWVSKIFKTKTKSYLDALTKENIKYYTELFSQTLPFFIKLKKVGTEVNFVYGYGDDEKDEIDLELAKRIFS